MVSIVEISVVAIVKIKAKYKLWSKKQYSSGDSYSARSRMLIGANIVLAFMHKQNGNIHKIGKSDSDNKTSGRNRNRDRNRNRHRTSNRSSNSNSHHMGC